MRAYRSRWLAANAAEIAELRSATPTLKLRQLAALMDSMHALGWDKVLAAEEAQVRDIWRRLRHAAGA
jgi:hypothetical protein